MVVEFIFLVHLQRTFVVSSGGIYLVVPVSIILIICICMDIYLCM